MFGMGENQTTWRPGESGNPKGRPKGTTKDKLAGSLVASKLGLEPEDLPKGLHEAGYADRSDSQTPQTPAASPDGPERPETARSVKKLTDAEVREGLRALLPAALLRMERDIMSGGEKASQQARYVLDQVIGKPTETVKHTGEGPGWEIRWAKLSDKRPVPEKRALTQSAPHPGVRPKGLSQTPNTSLPVL